MLHRNHVALAALAGDWLLSPARVPAGSISFLFYKVLRCCAADCRLLLKDYGKVFHVSKVGLDYYLCTVRGGERVMQTAGKS